MMKGTIHGETRFVKTFVRTYVSRDFPPGGAELH